MLLLPILSSAINNSFSQSLLDAIQSELLDLIETENCMKIEWDRTIPMDDGLLLRADIFRPIAEGGYPAIL